MRWHGWALTLGLVAGLWLPTPAADGPYRIAAGANVGGGQLDWRINSRWMIEARAQTGSDRDVEATLVGARAYRFFSTGRPSFFGGLELAGAHARLRNSPYHASGWAGGLFGGMEIRLVRHVFLLLDAGPYVMNLKEDRTGVTDGSADFVADVAVVVGF